MIVRTKSVKLKGTHKLECGKILKDITVAYETYGEYNGKNAILIMHALSGDAHAAGKHKKSDKKAGWWNLYIGPGKAIDTNKFFIICANVLGGCKGTTGPASINPETGKKYKTSFPIITIKDMVNVQAKLLDHLKIEKLHAVVGGSMGGMQVLQFVASYPERAKLAIPIATSLKQPPQAIAFHEVGRQAITKDPKWKKGNPEHGLSIARMVSHITYLSEEAMWDKFGRKLQGKNALSYDLNTEFQVESYLKHQGFSFTQRFDANSYLYITRAIDYFDLTKHNFQNTGLKTFVLSISSDWLYSTDACKEIVNKFVRSGINTSFVEIKDDSGHDAFLLNKPKIMKVIKGFIENAKI